MAIDSRDKRASAVGIGLPWRRTLPTADNHSSRGDRRHLAYLYSGIVDAVSAVVGPIQTVAAMVFCGGGKAAISCMGGGQAAQHYTPGGRSSDARIPGGQAAGTYIAGSSESESP